MTYQSKASEYKKAYENLKVDCKKCFGFCCVALYFSVVDGFPTDKDAGKPCVNLQSNFSCSIHENLREKGLKGCTAYDCFGAGQKVAQVTYNGRDWKKNSELEKEMFAVFLVMEELHEMLWYLTEAHTLQATHSIWDEVSSMAHETEQLTNLDAKSLIALDVAAHREKVNALLLETSELVRNKVNSIQKSTLKHQKTMGGRLNFIGADLRKTNLRGANLRGAFLIAANLTGVDLSGVDFIGADLRDASLRTANLTDSIFITQAQINAAKGDSNTKLPLSLIRPSYWDK